MIDQQLKSFELLKQKVEVTFRKQFTTCQESIHDWKGKQIAAFQEDLGNVVGGYVSEKWFYTHLKVYQNEKLPRIDMLNLLSQYVGAANWDDFVYQNPIPKTRVEEENVVVEAEDLKKVAKKSAANAWMVVIGLLFIIGMMVLLSFFNKENSYRFCVVDQDDGLALEAKNIQVFWLKPNESPLPLKVDSTACVEMPIAPKEKVTLEIQALYYKTRTITRSLNQQEKAESIELKKDDYALMIHYFSTNKMEDWNKRREQLALMLSDNARIVQLHSTTGSGMALYNKEEFINKMTMPIKSLKNIEILQTKYEGEQIVEIRFVQKQSELETKEND